ncbi:hypothetical protein OG905_07355 [Streptomyces sp. NBC_00322]|uniref:hypothetical protein n=1 Tax=Streptomyces sp. NBC_00322 TaxID=2975712 RepID=UPI002E2CFC00|nr:hypothetical protein [Streptomyces sp. NBC_00322]
MPGEDRIRPVITDIDDAGQLIRYALAAQLARLDDVYGISQTEVALGADSASAKLSRSIRDLGARSKPTGERGTREGEWLRSLDSSIVGQAPLDAESLGGLNSLGIRLRGLTKEDSLVAHLPANWTWEMLQDTADTEFAVLVHASALLSLFLPICQVGRRAPTQLREKYKHTKIQPLVRRLALIGGAPPTSRNIDALVLLGSLTKCAWDRDLGVLIGDLLRDLPLGFRLWRALTKLVHLCAENPASHTHLKGWITTLLHRAEELRQTSIYPGRSLDLELAIAIPGLWSHPDGPDGDWVHTLLLERAQDDSATLRERGTAALGLWQRTLTNNPEHLEDEVQRERVREVEAELRDLVAQFRLPDARPDAAAGIRWVAATLEYVLDEKTPVCNTWPEPDLQKDPWFQVVQDAADSLDAREIPARILQPTKVLFMHMLLQNAGVQRRQATDTLLVGGWTEAVIAGLAHVLKHEKNESWLRVRALFAIGYLQRRDHAVAKTLIEACKDAHQKLMADPTGAQITEMHAVLFAIGDCFGASFGVLDRSNLKTVRDGITPILRELATGELTKHDQRFFPVARALVYLLTFTAQNRQKGQKGRMDLCEELLNSMSEHPDELTRWFCEWTLRFRFTEDGTVQSLMRAADAEDG